MPVPEARQPGRVGQTDAAGVALLQPPRRVQVPGGQDVGGGLLAPVLQAGPGRVPDRGDTPGVRHRPGERARGAADRPGPRGHLRRGLHAGAQLRAQLFQELHARRPPVDQGPGGRPGGPALVHHVHGPAVGHAAAAGPSGRHQVFRLQVSQVHRPHRAGHVL